jgi:hypothetical protein
VIGFLKELFVDNSVQVRIGDLVSEPYEVKSLNIRQGCILFPSLFSLYVNDLIGKLKSSHIGVECGDRVRPG